MKKMILLSIALIIAELLTVTAQNNVILPDQSKKQNVKFNLSGYDNPKLSTLKKAKSGQNWWEPDTVYAISSAAEPLGGIKRHIFEYHNSPPQGFLMIDIIQWWSNNSWVSSYSSICACDSNNNKLNEVHQTWDNNSWVNYLQYTYTYDSNNNRQTELYQNWDDDSWKNFALGSYAYGSNNNLLTETWQKWVNNSWVNGAQYKWSYDENGNGTSVETWTWINERWEPAHVNVQAMKSLWLYYNNMQSIYEDWGCDKMTASYIKVSDINTGIESIATSELNAISIYPNPTKGELKIETGGLKIQQISFFDISGFNILNAQQTTLNISHFPPGMYFVLITTEKGNVTKKVVKR